MMGSDLKNKVCYRVQVAIVSVVHPGKSISAHLEVRKGTVAGDATWGVLGIDLPRARP